MKNNKKYISALALLLCATITFSACSSNSNSNTESMTSSIATNANPSSSTPTTSVEDITVKYDSEDYYFDWKSQSYQTINLNSDAPTITKSGVYEITGKLSEGSLVVDVDKSNDEGIVYLILNNADISSNTSAPIYIKDAKKVVLILEDGTQNTIYQGNSVIADENNEPSAAIFSKSYLTITGGGTLTVTSDFNDGITCKDELKITDGTLITTSAGDGIVGKDLLAVENGNITIKAGKDGMRSTNETDEGKGNIAIEDGTFNIISNNDGLQAYALLKIDGGTFEITTGGGFSEVKTSGSDFGGRPGEKTTSTDVDTESQKALKGSQSIIVNDGTFDISTVDDAIHSNGNVTITGGAFIIESEDDGIHSDTNIKITAGTITIKNCYEGIEAPNINIDNGKIEMTASDDGFNANDSSGILTINGGETYINSEGDGVDSNGSINMTDGIVYVDGPSQNGNGAIDYDSKFNITGGTLIAAGSSGMAQSPSDGTQSSILMYYSSTQLAGTIITLKDSNDKAIATFTPQKAYASVAISVPNLATGSTYSLYSNDTKVVTFKPTSTVSYLDESGITTNKSMNPGGGMGDKTGGGFGDMPDGVAPDDMPNGTPPNDMQGARPDRPQNQ